MKKIAIDVVLLPPEKIMDEAIKINQKLIKRFGKKIVLGKNDYLPHISLLMGCINAKQIPLIKQRLQEIAQRFLPINLKITGLSSVIRSPGEKSSSFDIEKTKILQSLHEVLIKDLSDFLTDKATKDSFIASPKAIQRSVDYANNFVKNASFEKFYPHIALGRGELDKQIKPAVFKSSRLALCRMGNHNTCRKILIDIFS